MKFAMEPRSNGGYNVTLDGVDRSNEVVSVEVKVGVDHLPNVTLGIAATNASVTFDQARVAVDEMSRDVLIQLGWTPPSAEGTA